MPPKTAVTLSPAEQLKQVQELQATAEALREKLESEERRQRNEAVAKHRKKKNAEFKRDHQSNLDLAKHTAGPLQRIEDSVRRLKAELSEGLEELDAVMSDFERHPRTTLAKQLEWANERLHDLNRGGAQHVCELSLGAFCYDRYLKFNFACEPKLSKEIPHK